jgi:cardiolipin synthase
MSNHGGTVETRNWRTIPNLLTALRMLLIVPFTCFALAGRDVAALAIWVVAGSTDSVDGYVARRLRQASRLGRLADPVADKLLTGAAFLVLSAFRGGLSAIPLWLMIAVIGRDILILLGCLAVYSSTRSTGFRPTLLGKANTFVELLVVTWFLASTPLPFLARALPALYVTALISILASAGDYTMQGIRMMHDAPSKKRRTTGVEGRV